MENRLRVLLIEDNPGDAHLIQEMLRQVGSTSFEVDHTDRLSKGLGRLATEPIDLVLLDLSLPDSGGLETLGALQSQVPQLPVIVLSGLSDEQMAIQAVREGAQDYLVKGQVDGNLLARAMRYAVERKRAEEERKRLILELQEALVQVKTLSGLLPICAACKKIRDDHGYWHQVEVYVENHSNAEFTHGICPECAQRLYPQFYADRSQTE